LHNILDILDMMEMHNNMHNMAINDVQMQYVSVVIRKWLHLLGLNCKSDVSVHFSTARRSCWML